MAWITCIVAVVDSAGARVDAANSIGEYQPIVLKLESGFVSSARDRGDGMTEVSLTVDGTGLPLGAADTVYSSDGATNEFRTNVSVTSLRATSYLGVGASGYLPTSGGIRLANGYTQIVGRDPNGVQLHMLSVTGANAIGVGSTAAVMTAYGTGGVTLVIGNGMISSDQLIKSVTGVCSGSGFIPGSGAFRLGSSGKLVSTFGDGSQDVDALLVDASGVTQIGDVDYGSRILGVDTARIDVDHETLIKGSVVEIETQSDGSIQATSASGLIDTFVPSLTLPYGETTNRIKHEPFVFTKESPDATPITFDVSLSYFFGLATYKIFGVKARILTIRDNASGSGEIEAAASYKYSGTTLTMLHERLPTGEVFENRMDNYAALPTLAFSAVSNTTMRLTLTPAGAISTRWVVVFDILAWGSTA